MEDLEKIKAQIYRARTKTISLEGLNREEIFTEILKYAKISARHIAQNNLIAQQEMISQGMLYIVENEHKISEIKHIKAWIYKILKHKHLDRFKIKYHTHTLYDTDETNYTSQYAGDQLNSPDTTIDQSIFVSYVNTNFDTESKNFKYDKAIKLKEKGVPIKEIAVHLKVTDKQVYKILKVGPNKRKNLGVIYFNKIVEGLSIEDVAEEFDTTPQNVYGTVNWLRNKIKSSINYN